MGKVLFVLEVKPESSFSVYHYPPFPVMAMVVPEMLGLLDACSKTVFKNHYINSSPPGSDALVPLVIWWLLV